MDEATKEAEVTVQEVQAATSDAVEQVQKALSGEVEHMAETVKQSVAETTAQVEAVQTQLKQGINNTMKTAEEVLAFGQGNVEAFIKSGQIWSAGLQDISKQFASSAQASYEEAVAAFKALTTVKSLKEAVDLQVGLARSMMEKSVAESNKYTDASFKLAEQAIAPISSRVTLAVEKFGKTV
jgi:phasin family protein